MPYIRRFYYETQHLWWKQTTIKTLEQNKVRIDRNFYSWEFLYDIAMQKNHTRSPHTLHDVHKTQAYTWAVRLRGQTELSIWRNCSKLCVRPTVRPTYRQNWLGFRFLLSQAAALIASLYELKNICWVVNLPKIKQHSVSKWQVTSLSKKN